MRPGAAIWFRKERELWFRQYMIHAETSRSWVCIPMEKDFVRYSGSEWWIKEVAIKLPKNFKGFTIAVDNRTAQLNNWAFSERYKIGDAVEHCCDPTTLLAVAKLMGFTVPEDING